jgi:hypothetical protein
MAKIKFGAAVADARNAIGGTVFSKNQFGGYIRQKVSPVQKRNSFQQNVRARLQMLATYWSYNLSDAQRAAWVALAAANPVTDIFGDSQILTAEQLFVGCNANILKAGGTMIEDAPADLDVTTLASVALTAEKTADTLSLAFTVTPLEADECLVVYATQGLPSGKTYIMNFLKMIVVSAAAATSPLDILAAFQERYGEFQLAQRIWVKASIVNTTNGAESAALCAYADVVAGTP